jgi:TetR/AcrR family transcriptional repressor of nem operon
MARPRAFDTDLALDRAMDVFWELGYEEATLPDLLSGMQLTRGSLYKAFKDKKSLFLITLDRYEKHSVADAVAQLADTGIPDGWDRIMALFHSIADAVGQDDRRGCLLCSAAAGPASYDPDIAHAVHRGLGQMRAAFEAALPDDGPALADLLVTQYTGLRILSRSRMPAPVINASINNLQKLRDLAT